MGLDSVEDVVSSENPLSRKLPLSLETFLSFETSIRYMLTLLIYPMTFNFQGHHTYQQILYLSYRCFQLLL